MSRSWKPKRRGAIYCSPACGANCTWANYIAAKRDARALILRLARYFGDGWKPRIWENGGWHYEVRRRTLVVSPRRRGYYAFVGADADAAGAESFCWGEASTPRAAVLAAIRGVRREKEALEARIAATGVDLGAFR